MIKPLAIVLTSFASAGALAGCPPPDEQPAPPPCEVTVQLVNEPSKAYVDGIPDDCIANLMMTPGKANGLWPYPRCFKYWGGTGFVETPTAYICENIDH